MNLINDVYEAQVRENWAQELSGLTINSDFYDQDYPLCGIKKGELDYEKAIKRIISEYKSLKFKEKE